MTFNIINFLVGLLMLTIGGEALIRGSLTAAKRLGISPMLSGLIIVGFGTSAPELVVSINAALDNQPDVAIGNVLGSNIGNILLILGVCAIVTPLTVKPSALKRDAVTAVIASILFIVVAADGSLNWLDAVIMITALLFYLVMAYFSEKAIDSPSATLHQSEANELSYIPQSILFTVVSIVLGLSGLVFGAQLFLTGATGIALHFGLPEALIGLTLVAVGTSLPEFSISLIAAIRRHTDVAVGNILGSNIFNVLGILGVSVLFQPLTVPSRMLQFDQWVMVFTSMLLLLLLLSGRRLSRGEGVMLLIGYGFYIYYSVLAFEF